MSPKSKLTLKEVAILLCLVPISITRLSKSDPLFPTLERIGRSLFIDVDSLYQWLSIKAGKTITPEDELMTSKQLEVYFSKSHTWLWQQTGKSIPEPFKINRTNYWLERDIIKKPSCIRIHKVA